MPFQIVRNDIVNMQVDAIVNSANPRAVVGLGTDSAIHEKAGPELLAARQKIGSLAPGQVAITPGFRLPAKYVIHTVGPVWEGGSHGEEARLRSCYENSLQLAWRTGCRSAAFPLIATSNYGFPRERALEIALSVFREFLTDREMEIYLVVFDRESVRLSEKLVQSIASYIDDHYVAEWMDAVYGSEQAYREQLPSRRADRNLYTRDACPMPCAAPQPKEAPAKADRAKKPRSLAEMLQREDAGFTETLLRRIDESGRKDSEIYKKANLSKQHFSKIRNNPHYQPTKATALALCIALELNLEQTRDLIGRAGYALTNSSKADLIIMYFIENRIYDVMQINLALYEFDQSLLGS